FFIYIFVVILMKKTSFGFKVKTVGKNPELAKNAGIKIGTVLLSAQFIGGSIAGAGGAIEMLGVYDRFLWQSQVSYVWDGLMVHMLANGNPVYIPLTALFIAYLRIGSEIMSRATNITPEVISFLQGIVIVLIASERFLYGFKRKHDQRISLENANLSEEKGAKA
ncbi:MAG: ABC transporter permease, partial [Smithella sp.]